VGIEVEDHQVLVINVVIGTGYLHQKKEGEEAHQVKGTEDQMRGIEGLQLKKNTDHLLQIIIQGDNLEVLQQLKQNLVPLVLKKLRLLRSSPFYILGVE